MVGGESGRVEVYGVWMGRSGMWVDVRGGVDLGEVWDGLRDGGGLEGDG